MNIRMHPRLLIFKFWVAVIIAMSLLSCVSHTKKNNYLEYVSGNESFVLRKECVRHVSLPKYGYAKLDKDFAGIFVKVKSNAMCSGKFNNFFRKNIGNDLYLKFEGKDAMKKTRIISEIITENGYYQSITDESFVEDILKSYNE